MTKNKVSKSTARRFLLAYQHLLPPRQLEGKNGMLQYFTKAGCIQYDPLNIAGRNAEPTLQLRIKKFKYNILDELLYSDRLLIDGWDKMMSVYRREDWPLFKRIRSNRERQIRNVLGRRNSLKALTQE